MWSNWESSEQTGGFDAVVGNPPWDRLKLQEVEWWAARKPGNRASSERRRLALRAKLDALYFHLYGITDRDDVRYIYSTFPIVEREEAEGWGQYASRDLCLAWMNALNAGKPDEKIDLPN